MKKNSKRTVLAKGAVLMLLAIAMVGCGGSNNNGNNTIPLTSNLRTYTSGDSWTYGFNGTYTPKGGAVETDTGTLTRTVQSVANNQVTFSDAYSTTINGVTTNSTTTYLYNQSATTGALTLISYTPQGGAAVTVTNTTFSVPGTLSDTTDVSGNTTYSNGNTAMESFETNAATPQVNVTTSLATFQTYDMDVIASTSTGTNTTETQNFVPALGEYVEDAIQTTDASGNSTSGTYTLTATSVPSSQWGVNPASSRKSASR